VKYDNKSDVAYTLNFCEASEAGNTGQTGYYTDALNLRFDPLSLRWCREIPLVVPEFVGICGHIMDKHYCTGRSG
jgi:hypothetical protein